MCLRHAPDTPQTCSKHTFMLCSLKKIFSASLPPEFQFEKQLQLLPLTCDTDREHRPMPRAFSCLRALGSHGAWPWSTDISPAERDA